MPELSELAWPLGQLGAGLEVLARQAGLKPCSIANAQPLQSADPGEPQDLDRWLDWAAARLGIEAEAVESTASEFKAFLRKAGPAVLRYPIDGTAFFLLLLKASARTAYLIGRDLRIHRCALDTLSRALLADLENAILADVRVLLRHANIQESRWAQSPIGIA